MAGGLPQGCLTEVYGPASSGRTSLMLAAMAQSTGRENVCALVDASDAFDPASAAAAGVRLERLLWVRCGGNAEHALKAVDLLVQGGGFGLVVSDPGRYGRAAHAPAFQMTSGSGCGAAWSTRPLSCWWWSSSRLPRPALRWCWRCGASGQAWWCAGMRQAVPETAAGHPGECGQRKPVPALAAAFESRW